MDPLIAIASLSVKAINTYFNSKKEQLLQQITKQNEELIALSIYQYNQSKMSTLERATQELQDGLICSDPLLRRSTLMSAYQDYTSLSILPLSEQLPNGTYINKNRIEPLKLNNPSDIQGLLNNNSKNELVQSTSGTLIINSKTNIFDKNISL